MKKHFYIPATRTDQKIYKIVEGVGSVEISDEEYAEMGRKRPGAAPAEATVRETPEVTEKAWEEEEETTAEDLAESNLGLELFADEMLFQNQHREPCICLRQGEQLRPTPLGSEEFQHIFADRYFAARQTALPSRVRQQAAHILSGRARRGPRLTLAVRIARQEENLVLDLADEQGTTAVIGGQGWSLQPATQPQFLHPVHLLPLPQPATRGDRSAARPTRAGLAAHFEPLRALLPAGDAATWPLLLAWLTGVLNPSLALPMLCLTGPQGSGKSTLARALRRLLDPSRAEVMALPEESAMAEVLRSHAVPIFDNLGTLNRAQANMLCRAVTGSAGKATLRQKKSGEFLRRPMILTALELPSLAADWLDRSLVIELEPLASAQRMPEAQLWPAFAAAHPRMLAGLLDLAAATLPQWRKSDAKHLPRMADYAAWGMAMMAALGEAPRQFLDLLAQHETRKRETEMESEPLAQAVLELMHERKEWAGGMLEILEHLTARARPQSSSAGRKLRALRPLLAFYGLQVEFERTGKSGQRAIRIRRD